MIRLTSYGARSPMAEAMLGLWGWGCLAMMGLGVVIAQDDPLLKTNEPVPAAFSQPKLVSPTDLPSDPTSVMKVRIEQQLGGAGRANCWYVIHLAERRWIRPDGTAESPEATPTAAAGTDSLKACTVVEDIKVIVVNQPAAIERLTEFLSQAEVTDGQCRRVRRSWQLHRRFEADKREHAEKLGAELRDKLEKSQLAKG